jgi:hypothetical protein
MAADGNGGDDPWGNVASKLKCILAFEKSFQYGLISQY